MKLSILDVRKQFAETVTDAEIFQWLKDGNVALYNSETDEVVSPEDIKISMDSSFRTRFMMFLLNPEESVKAYSLPIMKVGSSRKSILSYYVKKEDVLNPLQNKYPIFKVIKILKDDFTALEVKTSTGEVKTDILEIDYAQILKKLFDLYMTDPKRVIDLDEICDELNINRAEKKIDKFFRNKAILEYIWRAERKIKLTEIPFKSP
jgi:hypothetical protein